MRIDKKKEHYSINEEKDVARHRRRGDRYHRLRMHDAYVWRYRRADCAMRSIDELIAISSASRADVDCDIIAERRLRRCILAWLSSMPGRLRHSNEINSRLHRNMASELAGVDDLLSIL